MRKRLFIFLMILSTVVILGFNGDLQYFYGYNFSKDASTTISGLKANLSFENSLDTLYYKLSLDLFKLKNGKTYFDFDINNYSMIFPSEMYLIKPNVPWMLYVLNEAYADIYFDEATVRFGRFILNNGSSTLYSPSVLLSAHDGLNPFENYKALPVEGININGYLGDYVYDLTIIPETYDNISDFVLYPKNINENIIYENAVTLTYQFTESKKEVENATEELINQLIANGLDLNTINTMLNNPLLLKNVGLSDEQIYEIYAGQTLMTLPSTYEINTITAESTNIDELNAKNMNYAAKISFNILGYDLKMGFVHDHYHFMVPEKIDIKYSDNGTGVSNTVMYRPSRNSVTLDIQGVSNFFDSISYHGEAAFIMPEKTYTIVNTSYYVPDTLQPTETTITTNSTNIDIFDKYYAKAVAGIEYTKGEDLTIGIEGFNGLPTEELKDHISFGGDTYIKAKYSNIAIEGLGLVAFSKINDEYKPGYMTNIKLSYSGIDNFEPSIKINYAYAEDNEHSIKQYENLNSISLSFKTYF
ncbi:hypothetical protein [Marinitoga sp. 38H-ov]|uniref:hypothetical protein n=1 Tax=Marinitoga sp. 38H-ov TaxID=1755814 RepID=UPI0013ECB58A|nr:hypothetical protein [Marinitoga sp. 38H-ov]KAF2955065.1 hypothetical protein AS160_02190 [Marinitoga sp. 38H-ov]